MAVWAQVLISIAGAAVLLWVGLIVALWRFQRRSPVQLTAGQALRLLPDLVRLTRRLATDPLVPRGVRVRLFLLLGYLVLPIDLVPDVIPGLGYLDDMISAALVIRSAIRTAGPEAIVRHWPGDQAGLEAVLALSGRQERPNPAR
jgi:uncharacterized membrane protein YkvA (DUF1232 family)